MSASETPKKTTQRVIPIESPCFVREETLQKFGPARLFSEMRPLALEIGCGTGDFIIEIASQHPDLNFLAVDIYNKGCLKTCRKVDHHGLGNVRVLRMEARNLLRGYLKPQQLQALYINCPDPWPKKRHQHRRLINNEFLEMIRHFLAPAGNFFFCTDFADYAQQVISLFPFPGLDNCLPSAFSSHLDGYPLSKYMLKFRQSGLPLYFMHYRKSPYYPENGVEAPPYSVGFQIPNHRVTP